LEIEAIYHRNDPIILGVPPIGGGSDEMARYRAIMRSAMLKQQLRNAGVPDVTQVWPHEIGASRMLVALAIKQRYPGHANRSVYWPQVAAPVSMAEDGDRRRRRHRRVESRPADVGDVIALRPGNFGGYTKSHAQHTGRPTPDP
jgi:hypothetical protein